jgi:hypothetical protein
MLLKLVYRQGVIRYKMQYMHSIAYVLYYVVISNCIIASILIYYITDWIIIVASLCKIYSVSYQFVSSVFDIFNYGSYSFFHNTYNYCI